MDQHKPNEYNFHCLICGQPFKSGRRHAQTCSTRCRSLLAEYKKTLPGENKGKLTEEEEIILRTLQDKLKNESPRIDTKDPGGLQQ